MKYLRYVVTILTLFALGSGYFVYLVYSGQMDKNSVSNAILAVSRPYPDLMNPKNITLNCDYHGKNITLTDTLYGSIDNYYKTDPNKKNAYLNNREQDFVFSYSEDNTIKDLASKIKTLGVQNGLDQDQTLDLGACLLQSIPYDNIKAQKILGPDFSKYPISEVIPRYPYETLYDDAGICTDKTFLGAAVFNDLGYKTAIMTFDSDKHMSLGVGVTGGYGSFGTSYGIMELTGTGFLVGDVPELSSGVGLAINNFQTQPNISSDISTQTTQVKLSNPSDVIPVSSGTNYARIVQRTAVRQKLEGLKPQLDQLKAAYQNAQNTLKSAEQNLKTAENTYRSDPSNATYNAYLQVYGIYQADYNAAQAKIDSYNQIVDLYNGYVGQYKQF